MIPHYNMTAGQIRHELNAYPDDTTQIPAALRRELFAAMKEHDTQRFAAILSAYDATKATITRALYFRAAQAIEFPIHEWLEREAALLPPKANAPRGDITAARAGKGKLAIAVAQLETLGYVWHGPSNKFVKIQREAAPNWD